MKSGMINRGWRVLRVMTRRSSCPVLLRSRSTRRYPFVGYALYLFFQVLFFIGNGIGLLLLFVRSFQVPLADIFDRLIGFRSNRLRASGGDSRRGSVPSA